MRVFSMIIFTFCLISCSKDNDPAPPPPPVERLGQGWKKVQIPTEERVLDIFFINSRSGFLIAGKSIYHSTDGGNSWEKVYHSLNRLINISMGSANNAIFAAGDNNTIYVTRDGGRNFDSVILADQNIQDVYFINADVAFSIGNKTFKTTDAGKTWHYLSTFSVNTPSSTKATYFLNEQVGWVTGDKFFKTTNGGLTWETMPNATFGSTMGTISFPDANTGYVADAYSINKTTDGGTTFKQISTLSSSYFHDVHFITPQEGFVTDNLFILKTRDGGITWTKEVELIPGSLGAELVELHFTDSSHGWAAGSGGYILKYEK